MYRAGGMRVSPIFRPIRQLQCEQDTEITLHNGYDPVTKKQLGIKTGDPRDFKSIEDVMKAYEAQQDFFMEKFINMANTTFAGHAFTFPTITASCFSAGCIEKGKMLQQKGSDHHYDDLHRQHSQHNRLFCRHGRVSFNKHYLTMGELLDLMDTNFEGKEEMRQLLINGPLSLATTSSRPTKYGEWFTESIDRSMKPFKDAYGGPWTSLHATVVYNAAMGKTVGAMLTEDWRLQPFADNASPMIGMDVNGPTVAVNSLAACDELMPQSGMLLNQRFDPTIAAGEKGIDIIETVFRAHFAQGGYHIQINVLDDETLLAAQKEPDKYKNIIVRVAGVFCLLCGTGQRDTGQHHPEDHTERPLTGKCCPV